MCNIAGYAGNKQAAPILIEMLKREECFDGGFSAGVATLHDGKIHYRKVIGTVDDLVNNTDVLSLPGTIGIAHTRPGGDKIEFAHPQVFLNDSFASISNGDIPRDGSFAESRSECVNMLADAGYDFPQSIRFPAGTSPHPQLKNGEHVFKNYVLMALIDYYMKQGMSLSEAHAKAESGLFAETVSIILKADIPDMISVFRATRPMEVMVNGDETYIATTPFAFPKISGGVVLSLPTLHACRIYAGGYEVTKHKVPHSVCPITPMTYIKAYDYIVNMFNSSSEPLTFHDLQVKLDKEHPEIWHEKHYYTQYAKVVYDILWQLNLEDKLNIEIKKHTNKANQVRNLAYMTLK